MIYLLARDPETEDVIALVVANRMPKTAQMWEQVEMDLSGWIDEHTNVYYELSEVTEAEWTTYLAFDLGKPYRICAWTEPRFVERSGGVEQAVESKWEWTFHEATDLVAA